MTSPDSPSLPLSQSWLHVIGSRYFLEWLQQQRCSLAFTTYQTGKLFLVGRKSACGAPLPKGPDDQALSVFERTYNHCMGMWASPDARTIWLSTRFQIWRLEQAPATVVPYRPEDAAETEGDDSQQTPQWAGRGYDYAYIPRVGYTTGHVDVHDLALDADGNVVFVNTMFGCLATLSERANFRPLWRLPFLTALVPEDRCHLNGLAMRDGRPAFVTVVSRSDVADGWRGETGGASSMSPPASPCAPDCRCPTHLAGIAISCGCSIRGRGSLVALIFQTADSSRSPFVLATCAD